MTHGPVRRWGINATHAANSLNTRSLPPGDYLLSAIEDVEQDEWLDPAFLQAISGSATRISLNERGRETKDLRLLQIP